jgi:hypothetical protein
MKFATELNSADQEASERKSLLAQEFRDLHLALLGGGIAGVIIG